MLKNVAESVQKMMLKSNTVPVQNNDTESMLKNDAEVCAKNDGIL